MKRVLITGICGFAAHHLVEHIIKNTDWDIVGIDKLGYASEGFERIKDINVYDDKRVTIFTSDFTQPINSFLAKEIGEVDYIIHMGAETSVDNSISNPEPFVMTNILGTMRMLDFARTQKNLKLFFQFSTDEVYGPAPKDIKYKETDRLNSTNPYAASKAGAEQLAMSYANCYNLPVVITNTMNIFGERQHPEKFIPNTIKKILNDEIVTIHANSDCSKAGSRFYIHARNVASAIVFLIDKIENYEDYPKYYTDNNGLPQYYHRYNIVGEMEVNNLDLAHLIATTLNKPLKYQMVNFHSSRPGHDLRYALSMDKMKNIGWEIPNGFIESLTKTITWTLENPRWIGM